MAGTCSNELTDNGRPDYDFMIKKPLCRHIYLGRLTRFIGLLLGSKLLFGEPVPANAFAGG